MAKNPKDIDYKTYLKLPEILAAQQPISGSAQKPFAHDEMLFIIVHQTYELWFKQVLFEIGRVQEIFSRKVVADRDLRVVSAALERVVEIMQHLVRQIDLLETMTPLDFLDFRHVFRSASGFQSLQFRELEIRLGLRSEDRVSYAGKSYESYLSPEDQQVIREMEKKGSLFDQIDKWLSRTPFVTMGDFDFWKAYRKAVADMVKGDKQAAQANTSLSEAARQMEIDKLDNVQKQFDMLFSADAKDKMTWRLSSKALQAALFIMLYRDQPVLQAPFRILNALMDIDETMTLWRYRHALMVQRMLGMKMGSGGSSGHDYLAQTAAKNRIFLDLFALSTFMIPRSTLSHLPKEVEEKMGFRYGD
jgi:tryptophan 2,3-dioxygenase